MPSGNRRSSGAKYTSGAPCEEFDLELEALSKPISSVRGGMWTVALH